MAFGAIGSIEFYVMAGVAAAMVATFFSIRGARKARGEGVRGEEYVTGKEKEQTL